jgi:hypothetical protein
MPSAFVLVLAIVALGFGYVVVPVVAEAYTRYRGRRIVTCPETKTSEEIAVDARRAAISAAFGEARLDVTECSRWTANAGCARACLAQVDAPAAAVSH